MKSILTLNISIFAFIVFLITATAQQPPIPKDASYYRSKGYQVFAEFKFAVKCPCMLSDISQRISGDNDISYGCIVNENSDFHLIMYQILVKRVPQGYFSATTERKNQIEENLFNTMPGSKQRVVYNGVNAVVVSYESKGRTGKAIAFIKNGATFTFNLLTNDALEEKFNSLTNNIKFF